MIFSCPDGYLTRAEVFEQAFERLTAGCRDELVRRLDAPTIATANTDELEAAGAYGTAFTVYDADIDKEARRLADWDADDAYRWRVARLLGDATVDGRLPPYIRGPNGQMERLDMRNPEVKEEEWRQGFYNFANEIHDPGPDAFWRVSDFEALLRTLEPFRTGEPEGEQTPEPSTPIADPAAVAGAAESPPNELPVSAADDTESKRWQRDPVIAAIKTLHPPDGIPSKRITNEAMRKQLNKLPQFKDKPIRSKETVRLARIEIRARLSQK
jgi:hypothetical protein